MDMQKLRQSVPPPVLPAHIIFTSRWELVDGVDLPTFMELEEIFL